MRYYFNESLPKITFGPDECKFIITKYAIDNFLDNFITKHCHKDYKKNEISNLQGFAKFYHNKVEFNVEEYHQLIKIKNKLKNQEFGFYLFDSFIAKSNRITYHGSSPMPDYVPLEFFKGYKKSYDGYRILFPCGKVTIELQGKLVCPDSFYRKYLL